MRFMWVILMMSFFALQAREIIMGVVPQQSPSELLKVWEPIAQYLSHATGENVKYKTEKSITEFEKVLYSGGYDFAYMNPYHFVVAEDKMQYQAKVRATKDIVGILVGRENSDFEALIKSDPIFLFPSPNAFAATLLTQYELSLKYGLHFTNPKKIYFVNSHDSVYKGIARGIGGIGGGIMRTFKSFSDIESKKNLKVVYQTKAYPSHPFAFHNEMDGKIQKKLIDALLAMPTSLKETLKIKDFKKTDNSEYLQVKELAVKLKIQTEK